MIPAEPSFTEELQRLARSTQAQEDASCVELVNDARKNARAAVAHLQGADPTLAETSFSVLLGIEDVAIVPLIEGKLLLGVAESVRAMRVAVEAELRMRSRLIERIDQMLDDKTAVP